MLVDTAKRFVEEELYPYEQEVEKPIPCRKNYAVKSFHVPKRLDYMRRICPKNWAVVD